MWNKSTVQAVLLAAVLGASVLAKLPSATAADPVGVSARRLNAALNEQVVMVPVMSSATAITTSDIALETTLFKPPGKGPFPVVIMNHGKALGNPHEQARDRFLAISREFVKRGYAVVIPMRQGFAQSTGEYADYGCNMTANGEGQASDIDSVVAWLHRQSWADTDRMIVAGQSYGGLTALAFGTHRIDGVKGLINFAGGLKVHGGDCRWQGALEKAFAAYGARTKLPSLWFYGANDQHFGPALASRLYKAYQRAGGHATLVAYGPFKQDAHGMAGSHEGVKIWWPETEKFLKALGMPTEEVVALADEPSMPGTDFAAIDDAEAIPYLKDKGREQYRAFLHKSFPRAFAISSSGAWSWVEDGDDPVQQALAECQKGSRTPCRIYAVDDKVVWTGEAPAVLAADKPLGKTDWQTGQ
jgi:dienelactone hydrolase